jgi:hypothetical protein
VRKYSLSDYIFQFITITAGVLIALLINSLVGWNDNRNLVREARATIAQEIAENKKEVETVVASRPNRDKYLDDALALADRLLANDRPATAAMNLGFNTADLSTAGWDTAASTGALAHMDYAKVQQYSRLYSHQAMFAVQQARAIEELTAALAIFATADPLSAKPADLERFRERVLSMKGGTIVEDQLADRLIQEYTKILAP